MLLVGEATPSQAHPSCKCRARCYRGVHGECCKPVRRRRCEPASVARAVMADTTREELDVALALLQGMV